MKRSIGRSWTMQQQYSRCQSSSSVSSSSTRSNKRRRLSSLLPVVPLLLSILLACPSFIVGRPHHAASSTDVHESKDAALSLSTKQEQLDHQISWQQPDYLPLEEIRPSSLERRSLSGPGSSPPQCTSKCGRCYPCRPVHVPIQPGLVKTAEYYPEAWRCKCGNKLFMP